MNEDLEIVLASYRDMFGVKTERANNIHRAACAEVARLASIEALAQKLADQLEVDNPNCEALTEFLMATGQI